MISLHYTGILIVLADILIVLADILIINIGGLLELTEIGVRFVYVHGFACLHSPTLSFSL